MDPGVNHVNISNARLPEQQEVLERISARGECPFCMRNFAKEHKRPILRGGVHWIVTHNQWPYEHTKYHLLLIPRQHVTNPADLHPDAWEELGVMVRWIEGKFGPGSGGFVSRFGDTEMSGGTVSHYHFHFIVSDGPVRFRIGTRE
ncbi:hypothetical protein A2110_02545 [Candidatus Jorgensenbacteria bacterium GWA1_54_12]|uniref:HIT domain-containing protein n=1 Tax=Candidatus Jorgensenbacteria bacterium GWA1_54_12 TaxID=1798468 RepID=A0A1F6BKJ3_9BACT|nr:MAG: hypothetical protein A2110_02545 [Candidatus Jorgensenbacteria bacterium GWA1_54_12]